MYQQAGSNVELDLVKCRNQEARDTRQQSKLESVSCQYVMQNKPGRAARKLGGVLFENHFYSRCDHLQEREANSFDCISALKSSANLEEGAIWKEGRKRG